MDSLQEILARKQLTKPDEITAVKDYVMLKYRADCRVKIERKILIISVPNSALAATLQLERQKIIKACNLGDLRLVIRNGQ